MADKVRENNVGNIIHIRSLLEISNICLRNCEYCGLRCDNNNLKRYALSVQEIEALGKKAFDIGYKTIVLQSGEDDYFNTDLMCEIITEIKKLGTALTLSIGERSFDEYKAFRDAGADRYLIRIETTDKNLYEKMHPNMDYNNRLRCLEDLKTLGYEVGTGCLVGLPDQTIESLADDILFFKKINADMIGIGPFLPHPQTPLKDCAHGDFTLALKVMALTRIMLPDINIPATTAMETLHPNGRIIALQSGANVVMPNVTDMQYRKKYEIYPNKSRALETPDKCKDDIAAKIHTIDRRISDSSGFRHK